VADQIAAIIDLVPPQRLAAETHSADNDVGGPCNRVLMIFKGSCCPGSAYGGGGGGRVPAEALGRPGERVKIAGQPDVHRSQPPIMQAPPS